MKKFTVLFVLLCCILTFIPIATRACETHVATLEDDAYAVILDPEGNILERLELDVSVQQVTNARSSAPMYTICYTASDNTKTDSKGKTKDGVTVKGFITWFDNFGPDNTLHSIDVIWNPSNRTLSERYVKYGARNILLEEIGSPFYFYPDTNNFSIEQQSVTGYQFYLSAVAKINETGNYIAVNVTSTVGATN